MLLQSRMEEKDTKWRRPVCLPVWFLLLLWMGAMVAQVPAAEANDTIAPEYQVKAAFLYNFTKFVEWPGSAFSSDDAPIMIGILGKDPFGGALDQLVQGKTLDNHSFVIRRAARSDDLRSCHVVFISRSEKDHIAAILSHFKGSSTLTVSETEGFARKGGMINFTIEDEKVHFEINVNAAERATLKISSKLLRLGKIVNDEHR